MARRSFGPPQRSRPAARGFANPLRQMSSDIRKAVGESLREATRRVISELQEAGPAYSGNFRSKWYSQVEGRGSRVFFSVGVPRFTDDQLRRGVPTILIGNTAPYAQEAMDLIPGTFIRQEDGPIKSPVSIGLRTGRFRGDVKDASFDEMIGKGKKPAISTAEKNWFTTYMEGGGFSNAFRQGARTGFIIFARQ